MLPIYFTNTLTRTKAEFVSIKPGQVGFYSCGPTVYDRVTIGNLRAYIFADTIKRVLRRNGYLVNHVVNITDVGHLTDDGDEGEDKLERASGKKGESAWEIAKRYTEMFLADIDQINVLRPEVLPRATDHIAEQIAMNQAIEANGFAYLIDDGLYFDTAKLPSYGQLSGQKAEEKEEGARVAINSQKRNPSDFALWKLSKPDESRQMEWPSPWGVGFPGWHIECSAMGEKYLGVPFDIHSSGIDHIAVHHENELAQTMAARNCLEANVWLHNEFLLIDGGRMGKSLGNAYTLSDITDHGFDPMSYRYFLLQAHYRKQVNFTWEALEGAQNAYRKLKMMISALPGEGKLDEAIESEFLTIVNDDLDTAGALAYLWTYLKSEASDSAKAGLVTLADEVLGLNLRVSSLMEPVMSEDIKVKIDRLLEERKLARENKNFKKSDELRGEIEELSGLTVRDNPDGTQALVRN